MTTQAKQGLQRIGDGRWLDPLTGHIFNAYFTQRPDVLAAEERFQADLDQERHNSGQRANISEARGRERRQDERADREAAAASSQRQEQAALIQKRLPTSIAILSKRRAQIEAEMADDPMTTPQDREKAIMARLAGDPEMRPHVQFMESVSGFMEQNPGLIDPNALVPAPVGDDSTVASFVDQVLDDLSVPTSEQGQQQKQFNRLPTTEEARTQLEVLQAQLPDGTSEERRAFAEANDLAGPILQLNNFVQTRQQQERDIGITAPTLDEAGNPMNKPLTPQERGFVALPGGGYRPGNAIAGVPSLDVMNQLQAGAAGPAPRQYQGEIVGDNSRFQPLPGGPGEFTRNAVGVPGGGTMVADQARDPNAARFGTFQNADGSFSGIGATENRGGFANEAEAKQWSVANFTPVPSEPTPGTPQDGLNQTARSLLAGTGGVPPVSARPAPLPSLGRPAQEQRQGTSIYPTFDQGRADPLSEPNFLTSFMRHWGTTGRNRSQPEPRDFNRLPQTPENPSKAPPSWFPSAGSSLPSKRQNGLRLPEVQSTAPGSFTRVPREDERERHRADIMRGPAASK